LGAQSEISLAANLQKTGEHTFRRLRDDETLGEEIRFDIGPDGRATRMWQHGNFSPRIRHDP
jgi:hypothetical protein